MAKKLHNLRQGSPGIQPRRSRLTFSEALQLANVRAHDQANRRGGNRGKKFIWAAIADAEAYQDVEAIEWWKRAAGWAIGLLLLPLCWVTMWTLFSRFSQATVSQNLWRTAEFWYFAIGAFLMIGWFWSGLLRTFFLYLYVLGHELTHAFFVILHRGKVTEFHVSASGGYITTNKTNLIIALSPYFVPFWSVICAVVYAVVRYGTDSSEIWDRWFYGVLGLTWTFHIVWTLWMLPRDQPDLKDNGTFLSLVIIYFANLLVLAVLLCLATDSPLQSGREFGAEWLRYAATWGDQLYRALFKIYGTALPASRF